ncbi:MAG: hypothetical protein IPG50_28930 [Myxococcales bacterium]|nr:hypothetical protein [Myxococcales bacterium]
MNRLACPAVRACLFSLVPALALSASISACKDTGKISAQGAAENVAWLAGLADRDVQEIERGLPNGAAKLGAALAKSPEVKKDPAQAKAALIRTRREVPDLNIAKSTFFALTDEAGVGIRNNLEQDAMAGQNLVAIFPDLRRALAGEYVTTTGAFPGAASNQGPDKDWIAAAPVKGEGGKVEGLFVTGWAYRRFAYHLQESLRTELSEKARGGGDPGKLPVFYVGLFDKSGVYTAPRTPPVNEKALTDSDLVGKTQSGPYQGTTTITDRVFGIGAIRAPKLGPEAGVVVLRSEL